MPTKPLHENLESVLIETDNGDHLPIMDFAGAKFCELIDAVMSYGKAGKLTLKASFIHYLKLHGSTDNTTVYADVETTTSRCALLAVLNDHYADHPEWKDFRCSFTPKLSVEWSRWTGNDRKEMSQLEFAIWLEDNLFDIAGVPDMPSGGEMLAMAMGFEANSEKKLRSKINLQNGGTRFEFIDDETKETRTSMQVFSRFALGLPVFYGSTDAYQLEARLKYREKSGALTFWYELVRSDRVFDMAVRDVLTRIKESTGYMLLHGSVK